MTEEEAVLRLGKRFSMLRNQGDELPTEKVLVGHSMVLPEELADEYDKHFPPGPPRPKRMTERQFDYELIPLGEIRMGADVAGLVIRHGDREWDVLKSTDVFFCVHPQSFRTLIETTKCNRFDVITGWQFTFVVDKVDESLSVLRARYRIDSVTFCDETPILGTQSQPLETADKALGTVHFPFVPFERFWPAWERYVTLRTRQIAELRDIEPKGDSNI